MNKYFTILAVLIVFIMPPNSLNKSLDTVASSLHGGNGKPSAVRAYSFHTSEVICETCKIAFQKRNGSINEAKKRGFNIFCSKKCSGLGRRKESTLHEIATKVCKSCGEEKAADYFSHNSTGRWLNGRCRKCERGSQKLKKSNPVLNPEEVFVDIDDSNGKYRIGNWGTIISFGNDIDKIRFKILKSYKCPKGYLFSYIQIKGKRKIVKAHRLVAKYFIPNPENKPQVNHKDSKRDNPHYTNLEWATREENRQHAFDYGFACHKGVNHPRCKLTEIQVLEIFYSPSLAKDIALLYPVSTVTINNIKTGRIWSHLTKKIYKPKRKKYAKRKRINS